MDDNKEIICGYTEENPGEKSMMRLMNITSLWTGHFFGVVCVIMAACSFTVAAQYALALSFLNYVGAYAPKAIQKIMENENFFLFKK